MMKALYYTLLSLLLPFLGVAQQTNLKDTVPQEETTYKNRFTCDLELLLSANFSYQRRISNRVHLGGILGVGLPIAFPWNNRKELDIRNVIAESFNAGLVLNYKISTKWNYELSPQYSIFSTSNGSDGIMLDTETSALGIKNAIFLRLKKIQIGISLYTAYINIGYREESQGITNYWKLTNYNSFFKLRIPLNEW